MSEAAWCGAESLADPARSPSLAALAGWARRYRCYAAATLLEATADGHIYNSLVLAAPDGSFVTHAAVGSPAGSSGSSAGGSLALVRKHRASSLEGFVFRSAGAPGRGGEPAAHVVEVDAAPLLAKRGSGGSSFTGSSSSSSGGSSGSSSAKQKLRLAFSICYENFCTPPMEAIRVSPWRQLSSPAMPRCAPPSHPYPHLAPCVCLAGP